MNFDASRAKAIDKLNQFVEKNLSDYSKLRNFDFGPDKREIMFHAYLLMLHTVFLMKLKL